MADQYVDTEDEFEDEEPAYARRKTPIGELSLDPKEIVNEMDRVAADPRFEKEAPPETKTALAEAMNRAEQLYSEQATRNEWLELAQTLGNAFARYGAAKAGVASGQGRNAQPYDMSNMNLGPGIDYSKRTDRAHQEYSQRIRNLANLADREESDYKSREAAKKAEFNTTMFPLEQALRTGEHDQSLRARKQATTADDTDRKGRDDYNRAAAVIANDEKDSETEAAYHQKQLDSAEEIVDKIVAGDEVDSKTMKAWLKKDPRLAKLKEEYDAEDVFGRDDDIDAEKQEAIKEKYLAPYSKNLNEALDKLKQTRETRRKLAAGQVTPQAALTPAPTPSTQPPGAPPAGGPVRMVAPDGSIGAIPADQVEAAKAKGFKVAP